MDAYPSDFPVEHGVVRAFTSSVVPDVVAVLEVLVAVSSAMCVVLSLQLSLPPLLFLLPLTVVESDVLLLL